MKAALKRVLSNKVYRFNISASVFYLFGYLPYWNYQAKYLEIQFRFTAAAARYTQLHLEMPNVHYILLA